MGTKALYQNRLAAFEYDSDWLADSLQDGWGRLLVDRLMCFNVFAHNRDDHSKNFTFLYREPEKKWVLSPAYDLTYSSSIGGEHATMVNGNGRNPGMEDILAVAKKIGLNTVRAKKTASDIRECVFAMLGGYIKNKTG